MNTEAWHGNIMGLKQGLQVREALKQNKDTNLPNNNSHSGADSDADSATEDVGHTNKAPHLAAQADTGGVQGE